MDWVNLVIAGATLVGALGFAVRFVVRPVLRTMAQVDEGWPVLMQMARDFRPNGAPSLKARIVNIEVKVTTIERKQVELEQLIERRQDV